MAKAGLHTVFSQAACFGGAGPDFIDRLVDASTERSCKKGEMIFSVNEACEYFYLVAEGLVRVSFLSASGLRMTYLLAGPGEPINLVGPFTGYGRPFYAEAAAPASIAQIGRREFISLTDRYPMVLHNIIRILGAAVDSANSRILDMMDKRVHQRLTRVLYTLYRKFGSDLLFTSGDLAELAGTTTESTLRVMSDLREAGIIRTARGKVLILAPDRLTTDEEELLWL